MKIDEDPLDLMSTLLDRGFIELRCCDKFLGLVNPHEMTRYAAKRFYEIQKVFGNEWTADTEARSLLDDPASYTAPADGTPIMGRCPSCHAKFEWSNGMPVKIPAR